MLSAKSVIRLSVDQMVTRQNIPVAVSLGEPLTMSQNLCFLWEQHFPKKIVMEER
jgi:hypothetical protein